MKASNALILKIPILILPALALLNSGCAVTWDAMVPDPPPSVVVPPNLGSVTMDASKVRQDLHLSTALGSDLEIHHFRDTLLNGFHSAFGNNFVAPGTPNATQLVIDRLDISEEFSNREHDYSSYFTFSYWARWVRPDGKVLASVTGSTTHPRLFCDAITAMMGHLVDALDKGLMMANAPAPASAAAAPASAAAQ